MSAPVLFLDYDSTVGGLGHSLIPGARLPAVELVNELSRSGVVEVRWLSDMPAKLLLEAASIAGFTQFAVHENPMEIESPMSWWKGAAVIDQIVDGGAAAIWCDREIDEETVEQFSGERLALICPSFDGLEFQHIERIRAFVASGCRAEDAFAIIQGWDA